MFILSVVVFSHSCPSLLPCPPLSYPIVVELLSVVILLSPSLTEAVKQRVFGWEKHQTRPFTGGNNVIVIVIIPAILRQKTQTAETTVPLYSINYGSNVIYPVCVASNATKVQSNRSK